MLYDKTFCIICLCIILFIIIPTMIYFQAKSWDRQTFKNDPRYQHISVVCTVLLFCGSIVLLIVNLYTKSRYLWLDTGMLFFASMENLAVMLLLKKLKKEVQSVLNNMDSSDSLD